MAQPCSAQNSPGAEACMTTHDPDTLQPASRQPTSPPEVEGLVNLASPYPVGETLDRLETVLRAKGATVFARIDHAAAAAAAGLSMRPTQVLIFGNPRIGTPVMKAAPTVAIDLPFKALAWEDAASHVWLSYNSAAYLSGRHRIAGETIEPLSAIAEPIVAALQPDKLQQES